MVLEPSGWDVSTFLSHPKVLWAHGPNDEPLRPLADWGAEFWFAAYLAAAVTVLAGPPLVFPPMELVEFKPAWPCLL